MIKIYATLVLKGIKTLDKVTSNIRNEVKNMIENKD